ncbi:MAG: DUF4830 domain-containing protein [Clostridia bacterium]|nr:DUF4830 domain-containing protein [Clostridia bacterium]
MFFVVKKSQIVLTVLLILTLLTAVFLSAKPNDENIMLCRSFLRDLGYTFRKTPPEKADIAVPEGFGKVYESYNSLQKEAGFDLTPFRGKTVTRYTFRLTDCDYTLANILVSEGKICGGDILNPSLSGEMIPLIPNKKE